MATPKIDASAFEFLGEILHPPPPPPKPASSPEDEGWEPNLNPQQRKTFECTAKNVLAYGEKGSGKTFGCLHSLVRHLFENNNALALILVKQKAMATKGGAWDKLTGQVLPEWKEGIGLNYTDVKLDSNHNEFLWVENRWGSWSMAAVMSAPHANQLRERIRGYEPSFGFLDEATSCESREYFRAFSAQIGRRPGVVGLQQFYAACNPEGPSHWVYKTWWEECFNEETGEWDPDFAKFHVPIEENRANLPEGYIEHLQKLYKSDPIEADRMLRGIWVEKASGDALFRDLFSIAIHIAPLNEHGQPDNRRALMPDARFPFIIGMDPGAVYNSFSIMQWIPGAQNLPWKDGLGWMIFDEICIFKRKTTYGVITPLIMRRIKWWRDRLNARPGQVWNTDTSAMNQWRPTSGSYDVMEIEKAYKENRMRLGMEEMKVREAPKFGGSRQTRVRLMMGLLAENRIVVSSRCIHHRNMLLNLESEKQKDNGPYDADLAMTPRRSDYLHVFDSCTYPILTSTLTPSKLMPYNATMKIVEIAT